MVKENRIAKARLFREHHYNIVLQQLTLSYFWYGHHKTPVLESCQNYASQIVCC